MKLLLDIGNSSVNWAIQEQERFNSTGAIVYSIDTIIEDIEENLALPNNPASILVSNVAGAHTFDLINNWSKKKWQQECWQPVVSEKYGHLKNSYKDTSQMGLDRWLAMVAAWEKNQSAICLVSCGTALTIDLIDANGSHLGGYIIPGIELMQKALINNTVQINTEIKNVSSIEYASDTQTAINNGAFLAAVSIIDNAVAKFSSESNSKVNCIIFGGMAKFIKPLLNYSFEPEPNLVLMGLSILHKAR